MRAIVRNVLERCGLDVRLRSSVARARAHEKQQAALQKWSCLARYRPQTVLDIGANSGQFAAIARTFCPEATIVCFEPLADCIRELQERVGKDPRTRIVPVALGSRTGESVIHRSVFSPSSSLLPMGQLHRAEFPHTAQTVEETIQLRRLDDLAPELDLRPPLIAKIDVQGYECEVLRGGELTLRRCAAVIVEMSNYALYEGQPLFDEVYLRMRELGFGYRGNIDQLHSPADGRILQFDGLFENATLPGEPLNGPDRKNGNCR